MGNLDRLSLASCELVAGVGLEKLQRMNTDKALCKAVLCVFVKG